MVMAASSHFVLFALLVGQLGVQGSEMSFSSLLQMHMDSSAHPAQSGWKTQAKSFLSFLESMEKIVPWQTTNTHANQTKNMVDEIIVLLSNASNELWTAGETAKTTRLTEINGYITRVNEYDRLARASGVAAEKLNSNLTTCYADLNKVNEQHKRDCQLGGYVIPSLIQTEPEDSTSLLEAGDIRSIVAHEDSPSLIESEDMWNIPKIQVCERVSLTRKFKFAVAKQFDWTCNFTDGETDESCTSSSSELVQDLKEKYKVMNDTYTEWLEDDAECKNLTIIAKNKCEKSNKTVTDTNRTCDATFQDLSNLLCEFSKYIAVREEYVALLTASMTGATNVTDEYKTQWAGNELVVCVLRKFVGGYPNMTFGPADFPECQIESAALAWVPPMTVPLPPSTLDIEGISFRGGLAEKYLGHAAALAFRRVTLHFYIHAPEEPKLFLQLSKTGQVSTCGINDAVKTIVDGTTIADSKRLCGASNRCKYAELGAGKVRMGFGKCKPRVDSAGNDYTILRKVCVGGVHLK